MTLAEPLCQAGRRAGLRARVAAALAAQAGQRALWVPVFFGLGIAAYFTLPAEPGPAAWAGLAGLALGCAYGGARAGPVAAPLLGALALVAAGLGLAGLRAHGATAPVLAERYYGPIEGRVVGLDRSARDALRLTLDHVALAGPPPDAWPRRVRVTVAEPEPAVALAPGEYVMMTGHLLPPPPPAEPGDFDFRRVAWFERLGAVGWTQTPVLSRAPPEGGLWLHRLRAHLSAAITARIPGDAGGLAAAVMTGDRSGISAAANLAMRDSGLYHLVSISGMHMGLLVAFVFGLVRTAVALVPPLALRVNGKKAAALAALPVAAFYLALAGRDVATERAFVMVAVMLGAILLDRQAVTLRVVAVAATVVLLLRPESLLNPGFQMSFAAVVALAWAFAGADAARRVRGWGWAAPVLLLLFASLVAGLATAPYAAAHFNRFAAYGLLSNLLAVPAMGLLVMPGAVLLAIGATFGLTQPALLAVEVGCRWILFVAARVAAIEGAAGALPAPPAAVLPLLTLGALVLLLWRGRARWAGAAVAVAALGLWAGAERPALLITASGGTIGVIGPEGRAISRPTGDAFAVAAWLENDGDLAPQAAAADRPGGGFHAVVAGLEIRLVRGERALAALAGCGGADILVADHPAGPRPCLVLDPPRLAGTGAVALHLDAAGPRLVTVAQRSGDRLWTRSAASDPAPLELP